MRYMLLIYRDESVYGKLSEQERGAIFKEATEFSEAFRPSGFYQAGEPLEPTSTATTVRMKNGKALVTDGPFAETKEQLGGFFLIEAKDMDEACEVASRFPPARLATIEVRPVQELEHS
jgi:hypothetical protein